uniref:Reverse transcriptase domain-containing protein n=1 Tax=Tanacetum cinerariifolium TaxID=118510 RepID=A0A699GWS9_TANCI|nr:hypothetical protein [Tanacetum cinerariifolium]
MVDSQPMKEEVQGIEMRDEGAEIQKGPTEPTPQTQTTLFPSLDFVRENIDVLRTMIKELDHQAKERQHQEISFMLTLKKKLRIGVLPVLRISALRNGHGHSELAKKLNDKIPKTVDEMFERVRAFIRGEMVAGQKRARNRNGPREVRRNMGMYMPYLRRDTFTPLTKTLKEILAMEGISFLEPPPLIGIPEKQYMNKFCDYQRDRRHNTNHCYQLKKQIEKAIASGKLAHLVRDICRSNKKSRNQIRNDVKVINMIAGGRNRKRPYKEERYGLTEELTFPIIPQNSLTDEPIVLKGMIEGHQIRTINVDSESSSKIMELSQWKQARKPCGSAGSWKKCWVRGKKHNGVSTWNKCQEYKNKHYCEQV